MSGMLLSCADMPVIKQIADLLGIIMNAIFFVFDKMGVANIGLCIIIFTLIVKLLMIPMSIKQQKTTKLSSVMNPEIQAIQKKYKGKRDNDSMMAMNAETKAVYEKYGTSPTGGCLPMLIQMVILLALYGVISNIPSHVGAVKDIYMEAAENINQSMDDYDDLAKINQIMVDNEIKGFEKQDNFKKILEAYYDNSSEKPVEKIYSILSNPYTRQAAGLDTSYDAWEDMSKLKNSAEKILESLGSVSEDDWKKVKESKLNEYNSNLVEEYSAYDAAKYNDIKNEINKNYKDMDSEHNDILDVYSFAGIDFRRSPSQEMQVGIWWAIFIPILSALFQWLSSHLMTKAQQSAMADNPMMSSMKIMNVMMPIMSAFFCYSFASGLGLYWVIGSVFAIGQQFFINSYCKKVEVEDLIKANVEKMNKKRAKQGLPPQKITNAANTNVKSIKSNANVNTNANNKTNKSSNVTYKKGGIAAKANMVKEYNDKNNK